MGAERVLILAREAGFPAGLREVLQQLGVAVAGVANSDVAAREAVRQLDPQVVLFCFPWDEDASTLLRALHGHPGLTVICVAPPDVPLPEEAKKGEPFPPLVVPVSAPNLRMVLELAAFKRQVECKLEEAQRQTAQQLRESDALLQISQALNSQLDSKVILQQIVDSAAALIHKADRVVLHLLDEKQSVLEPAAVAGPDKNPGPQRVSFSISLQPGVAGLVLTTGETINLPDAPQDSRYFPAKSSRERVRSLLVAPVRSEERSLGTLSVHSAHPNVFTAGDERLLTILGNQAALALSKAQMFEEIQRRLKEANALYKITQGILDVLDVDKVLQQVVALLQENFGYYHVQVFLMDRPGGDLTMRQGSGPIGARLKKRGYTIKAGMGIVGHVALTGHFFVTNDVHETSFYLPNELLAETNAELTVPLYLGENVLGVIDIHHKSPHLFSDHDVRLMTTVANQVAEAIEKATIYLDLQAALKHEQTARAQLVQSEKLAALGRIVASVAHELNNPLQAIENALYLVKSSGNLDEQALEDIQVASTEAARMAELIARLRETYRPAASGEFRFESLNTLVFEVQRLLATHLRHNNVEFHFDPDPDLPLIPLIRDQIKQVILNISLNAVEAMSQGGMINVSTHYLSASSQVSLKVTDSGPGIPADVLPNIFDPFVTTKELGTGLGLSITYDIVQRHKGTIAVESKMNHGATFVVSLPLEQE